MMRKFRRVQHNDADVVVVGGGGGDIISASVVHVRTLLQLR